MNCINYTRFIGNLHNRHVVLAFIVRVSQMDFISNHIPLYYHSINWTHVISRSSFCTATVHFNPFSKAKSKTAAGIIKPFKFYLKKKERKTKIKFFNIMNLCTRTPHTEILIFFFCYPDPEQVFKFEHVCCLKHKVESVNEMKIFFGRWKYLCIITAVVK